MDAEARLAIVWRYRQRLPPEDVPVLPVTFWRRHWPRFDSEVKYQELCYTYVLYPPKGSRTEKELMVLEERARCVNHIRSNLELFRYLRNFRIDRNGELFSGDPAVAYRNSGWIATLWAFDRYEFFVEQRFPRICSRVLPLEPIVGRPKAFPPSRLSL